MTDPNHNKPPHSNQPLIDRKTVDEWVELISKSDLPSAFRSFNSLSSVVTNSEISGADLAKIILNDPVITAKVLRVANSCYFNATGQEINTISHAVALLGFDTIKNIAMSVTLFNGLLKGEHSVRLMQETAASFHAAVQSQSFSTFLKAGNSEEIFIASLLYRLGELACYHFAADKMQQLEMVMQKELYFSREEAEIMIFGFPLIELTKNLAAYWHLGEPLTKALNGAHEAGNKYALVHDAHQLVKVLTVYGNESKEYQTICDELAEKNRLTIQQVKTLIDDSTSKALDMAKSVGSQGVVEIISKGKLEGRRPVRAAEVKDLEIYEPDLKIQFSIVEELLKTSTGHRKMDVNHIIQIALEGMQRGVGLDRAMLGFLTPDKSVLNIKFMLDISNPVTQNKIKFNLIRTPEGLLLKHIIKTRECVCFGLGSGHYDHLRTKVINEVFENSEFMIGPLIIKDQVMGLFFGDRLPTKRKLDSDALKGFQMLINQLNLCLLKIS